jgi:hypothetical protein
MDIGLVAQSLKMRSMKYIAPKIRIRTLPGGGLFHAPKGWGLQYAGLKPGGEGRRIEPVILPDSEGGELT